MIIAISMQPKQLIYLRAWIQYYPDSSSSTFKINCFFALFDCVFFFFSFRKFAVSQQDNVAGHGTYVEYVDSGLYATSAQGQSQM